MGNKCFKNKSSGRGGDAADAEPNNKRNKKQDKYALDSRDVTGQQNAAFAQDSGRQDGVFTDLGAIHTDGSGNRIHVPGGGDEVRIELANGPNHERPIDVPGHQIQIHNKLKPDGVENKLTEDGVEADRNHTTQKSNGAKPKEHISGFPQVNTEPKLDTNKSSAGKSGSSAESTPQSFRGGYHDNGAVKNEHPLAESGGFSNPALQVSDGESNSLSDVSIGYEEKHETEKEEKSSPAVKVVPVVVRGQSPDSLNEVAEKDKSFRSSSSSSSSDSDDGQDKERNASNLHHGALFESQGAHKQPSIHKDSEIHRQNMDFKSSLEDIARRSEKETEEDAPLSGVVMDTPLSDVAMETPISDVAMDTPSSDVTLDTPFVTNTTVPVKPMYRSDSSASDKSSKSSASSKSAKSSASSTKSAEIEQANKARISDSPADDTDNTVITTTDPHIAYQAQPVTPADHVINTRVALETPGGPRVTEESPFGSLFPPFHFKQDGEGVEANNEVAEIMMEIERIEDSLSRDLVHDQNAEELSRRIVEKLDEITALREQAEILFENDVINEEELGDDVPLFRDPGQVMEWYNASMDELNEGVGMALLELSMLDECDPRDIEQQFQYHRDAQSDLLRKRTQLKRAISLRQSLQSAEDEDTQLAHERETGFAVAYQYDSVQSTDDINLDLGLKPEVVDGQVVETSHAHAQVYDEDNLMSITGERPPINVADPFRTDDEAQPGKA